METILKTGALVVLACLAYGCEELAPYPKDCTEYLAAGGNVQYIDANGHSCALVQCRGDDDLCLVTINRVDQQYILGRTNSMSYAERYCRPIKTVMLGGAQ